MIVGIMGTLKAGKIYVPLDPGYPVERLKYMLEDSDARLIVTNSENYEMAVGLRDGVNRHIGVVNVSDIIKNGEKSEENPGIDISSDQLAYILYTSGSTGKPKGVMQSQRNVLHFARIYTNALHINADDRLTLFSSYGFDAAKMDIYGALLNGSTLYPYDIKQEGNLFQMARWLQSEDITIYHSIPTVYRYFTDMLSGEEKFDYLRFIVLGGEAVFKKDVETYKKHFSDDCIFINGLGPTESTVTLQYFIDKNTEIKREAVPVGYAVEETEILLLDEEGNETEGYGIGEIIYKSDYLALGYLNKREKSDEVFVKNPLSGRDRVYRSGDLGRRLMDGSIEYVGRKDFQVKVRGYRIELGEIEGKLDNMAGIKKSVVVCSQDPEGDNYLTAYYMVSDERGVEIDENKLVNQLKASIPDYMVPGAFYRLEGFPLTATGKIDRKVLLESTGSQIRSMKEYVPPSEGIESTLANMWKELLKVEKVGIYDNFFVLGGNSLKAIMLTSMLHKELEVKLPLTEVFKTPTIRELAEYIKKESEDKFVSLDAAEKKEYYVLSSAQKRLYILHQMDVQSLGYNMPIIIVMEGDLNREKLEGSFRKLIERHESLRTSFIVIDEEPVQKIHKEVEFRIEFYDLTRTQVEVEEGIPHSPQDIIENFVKPFDLSRVPLLRVGLIKLNEDEHILMVDMHHVISDNISNNILVRDFAALYRGKQLPALKHQYKEYSEWRNSQEVRERIKQQELYWLNRFFGHLPVLKIPIDYPRPAIQSFEGRTFHFRIEKEQTEALKKLAQQEGVTLQMLMLAIFHILLSKLSSQEDIITGTTIAGRSHADLEGIIGIFVNTLALRNFPSSEKTFKDFLKEVKENSLKAYENQDYPIEGLVKNVVLDRNTSRNPIFDILFEIREVEKDLKAGNVSEIDIPGLKIRPYKNEIETTKIDMDWMGVDIGDEISFHVRYCSKLFKEDSVRLMADRYIVLIESVLNNNPQCEIKELEYSTAIEKVLSQVQKVAFDF
jgi:amino acid adenylation domain-containing protein